VNCLALRGGIFFQRDHRAQDKVGYVGDHNYGPFAAGSVTISFTGGESNMNCPAMAQPAAPVAKGDARPPMIGAGFEQMDFPCQLCFCIVRAIAE